ncbi:piRNA biogenesis protein EXD1 isoform X4 [Physeter macrocephalus]|uniref:PiRNA biogenesis protein EXD1 isoform X4 n=1 Tax=Physeter macrocephalus TaxID=9755 RepID=A0A455BRA2_PHYMC|nr:piRNA biogenesis protein EXD1 isoform X4 [Physeter catodon]|eukprot:XP_028351267.1 piRNA biogenesis protein EXD1 isoform X5 [Physeter catodon]
MDPSSDYHFLNQILWRRVKLTLVCGIFEGVLQHVDPNKIVVLKKVKNVETDRSVPGVKMFFGHEIVNVELLDEEEQGAVREKASSVSLNTERNRMDTIKDEDLNVYKPASPACEAPTTSLLNDLKYSPSEEEEVTYTVVDQFQQKFGAAMLHIKKQSVLSVAAEGANVCRHGRLCWLQVATNRRVYLFDIFLLGSRAFSNGLQMVLEDKRILKVIHDCRWLSDCLSHQYGILLNNVFDTQLTCMELPEELLQLKDFQRQRRERAAKEYRVNEQGLLIRTELHPKKSMTETAGKEGKVRDFLLCKNSRLDKAPHFTSHKDVNLLNEESKSKQTTAEPQHLPPIKEEVSEDSSNKRICPESEGFKDQRITQKEYLKIPKQEFQTNLSLKEEIEQLLMVENKEDLKYTKQDVLVSPSLPQETRVSPSDIFHPFRKAVLPTLPPCPALEKTDSWINPDSPNLP